MTTVDERFPYVAAWVQDGWVELGRDDYSPSFVRVLDIGGLIWEGDRGYPSVEHALAAADDAIKEWSSAHMPDLDVSSGDGPSFTTKQGQYLAFIHNYTQIHGRPPAEKDIERFFRTSPPTIHSMILRLESLGLLSRVPGQARTLKVLVPPQLLPVLVRPM